ncbi:TetR/AcrR family transcriptional regulator C-terminal domain-containing protein [Streptomyces sp. NPDC007251]|uniref:TetR/AcrR family transcriptional regulator C-terminal domain-containing protein n=1 Tax=unclassified Streptomyces TaxID=2593676 RepID=UPI00340F2040
MFRATLTATEHAVMDGNIAVLHRMRTPGEDMRPTMNEVAYQLVRSCCGGRRSRSLRWLTYAQVARFPDLIEIVQGCTSVRIAEAMADRPVRLSLAGRLRPCDPVLAAEQVLALITGPLETRPRLGTRKLTTTEMRTPAEAAVDTFLRAYAAD